MQGGMISSRQVRVWWRMFRWVRTRRCGTTSSSGPAPPAAWWPTAWARSPASGCCWWRPAATTTTTGSTFRSAICIASAIRVPTGCTRPNPIPASMVARCATRAARCWADVPASTAW